MRKILFVLALLWLGAAFAYAFYEQSAEAGLYARLLGWQLETFGTADINLSMFGAGVIYGLPGLITLSLTRSAGGRRPPDPVTGQRNAGLVFLAFGVVIVLVGIGAYVLHLSYEARQSETSETQRAPKLVSVNLDAESGLQGPEHPTVSLPVGADGVSVTGWLRREAQYALEEKGYVGKETVFCPFVGARWNTSEPVALVLRADPSASIALNQVEAAGPPGGRKFPKAFARVDFAPATPLLVTIEGTLRPGGLPGYAVSAFNKQGIKLANDYVVLEAKPFFGTVGRSEWEKFAMTSYLLTYLAVPLGLFFCLLSLIPFVRWRRLKAQQNQT